MLESFFYTSLLFKITAVSYVIALVAYLVSSFSSRKLLANIALGLFVTSFMLVTILIVSRWVEAGRPPFKSLYESLVFAVWTISAVSIVAELKFRVKLIGLLSAIGVVGILMYALTKRDAEIIALPPALQTWLFIPHVISYFLAYGALFVAGIASILHLVFPAGIRSHHTLSVHATLQFHDIAYQIVKFGFLFLTAGLLLGAWWGQNAWSNYWGWDPKENWAFISWLIFAAYLHYRNLPAWNSKKLAWVILIGVLAIIFTYLGMDYLPTANDSLHTYSSN